MGESKEPAEVGVLPIPFTPEEQAEFEAWDRLSDEVWAEIDWGDDPTREPEGSDGD